MPVTYNLIASNTLSSSAASVTFSAIPNTYTDLVLRVSARKQTTTGNVDLRVQFNSDTSSLYSKTRLTGDGATATTGRDSAFTFIELSDAVNPSTYTSNTFSNHEFYIPSYNVSQNKPIGSFSVTENNATTAFAVAVAGLYRSTNAISSIFMTTSGGNFLSGSSFFLYGIKNS